MLVAGWKWTSFVKNPNWSSNWMARSIWPMPKHIAAIDARMSLQEHGYHVLRFLGEDLGKRLDDVLDTILRSLAHQKKIGRTLSGSRKVLNI